MRTQNGFTNITARPLSPEQMAVFLRHPTIVPLVPDVEGDGDTAEIQIGRRRAVAVIRRRGNELVLSLTRPDAGDAAPISTLPMARVAMPVAPTPPPSPPTAPLPTIEKVPASKPSTGVRFHSAPAAPAPAANVFDDFSLDDGFAPSAAPAAPPAMATPAGRDSLGALDSLELGLSLELEDISTTKSLPASEPMAAPPPLVGPVAHAPTMPITVAPHVAATPQAIPIISPATMPSTPPPQAHPIVTPTMPIAKPTPRREVARAESGAFGAIIRAARARGASDLHVSAARVTSIRAMGELVPLEPSAAPLTAAAVEDLLLPLLDDEYRGQLDKVGYVDLALEAPGGGRLRANISRQKEGLKGTFRLALAEPATLEQLGLPADLAKVVHHHQGLIVIAGPSGHGKTTTLAALVDLLNSSRPYHILTIEDPIEIVHPKKQAVISQREAGRHTASFARGLKASLREDPDVIVIGELRDRESVEIALTAAETGHLVIATMSTPSAAKTIDRLIDMFPPEEHSQVRASIAGALRAIVAQRLVPRRGGGIVPAIELVTGVLPLAVLIREDKLYQLPNLLQRGRAFGMIRFDESLAELVRSDRIEEEAALAVAESKKDLAAALRPAAPSTQPKTTPIWGFGKKDSR